jgi:GT2 family glycosyltransferase
LAQDPPPAEVVVVVDHNERLLDRTRRELTGVTVLANAFQPGVSGNRNTGAFHTATPLIAMLDGDAQARPGWLAGLLAPFADPDVVGTGGAIAPDWATRQPWWFPDEFLWAVGASYAGMPTRTTPTRNVWSASMAVRRDVFESVGGFRVGFGKLGDRSRPEDTDLCLRMAQASGGEWIYVPDAVIDHPVPVQQTRIGYFLTRCYNEGRGKVELARLNHGRQSLGSERDYLRRTLPRAVGRGLSRALRGQGAANAAKAGIVVVGIGAAAVGGAVESLRVRRERASTVPARAGAPG